MNLPTEQHTVRSDTHTLEHNMYLFRAEIPIIYSQRLRSGRDAIANAVPRHDVGVTSGAKGARQAEATVNSVVEGASADKKTIMPIVENCTECNKELPGNFFACRSCPGKSESNCTIHTLTEIHVVVRRNGILILCNECAFQPKLANACDGHSFTDHILVLVRNRNASYIHGKPELQSKEKSEGEEPTIKSLQLEIFKLLQLTQEQRASKAEAEGEEPTVSALAEQVKSLQTQMSTMLELIQTLHTSLAPRSALE